MAIGNMDMAVQNNGVPDRGPAVFGVTTATLCLASIFVGARVVCRVGIVRRFSWDDWSILVAWCLAFGLGFAINWGTTRGLGRHDEDIAPGDRASLRRSEYAFSILYNPALMATKTSILIFFLRLSKNTKPLLRLASYVVLGIVNLAGTILTIMNIFQCQPIYAAFDDVPFRPKCIPLLTEFICSAPINIVTDLAILALPIPVLTSMRLPPRQKTILVLTFTLGVFVTIVDVVRIYYLQQAITYAPSPRSGSGPTETLFGGSPEFSWNASLSLMWSAVEVNVGITCACIPTLKPLIMRILPAMLYDPDGTRSWSNQTQDKDSMPPSAPTPKMPAFGAGGGLQAPPPSYRQNSGASGSGTGGGSGRGSGSGSSSSNNGPLIAPAPENEQISAMDFLTMPADMAVPNSPTAQRHMLRGSTATTFNLRPESSVYFGFVNIKQPKSVLRTSAVDSWKYCTLVTILFMLWGFCYGLLNTLHNVIAVVANMTVAQTLGLTSIYFGGGYFFGPLVIGAWILRHDEHHRSRHGTAKHKPHESIGGFKATFMLGLCIFGTGTIMFWPAAVLASFTGFMICNFVVGFGLAVLETAANPFLALCGPAPYAEMRLCLAQAVQAVGSVLSGVLAQHVYFARISGRISDGGLVAGQSSMDSMVLIDVQWTYLAVTLLCVALALFFYYIPLPEVTDRELERSAKKLPVDPSKRNVGGLKLRNMCLILAVVAQWTYVAAQECMSIFFRSLLTATLPPEEAEDTPVQIDHPAGLALSVPNYLVIAHTAFAVSRFGAGYLAYLSVKHPRCRLIPTPRTVLTISTSLQIVLAVAFIALRPPLDNPNLLAIPIVLFFLAEGPGWPLIFALGLRGQGKRTKLAAAWLTMGASGPAFWPFVMFAIINAGGDIQTAFIVVAALLCFTLAYPMYLTFVRDARTLVDPCSSEAASKEADHPSQASPSAGGGGGDGLGVMGHLGNDNDEPGINEILAERRRQRHLSASTTATATTVATATTAHSHDLPRFLARFKLGRLGRAEQEEQADPRTPRPSSTSPTAEHGEQEPPLPPPPPQTRNHYSNDFNDLSSIREESHGP